MKLQRPGVACLAFTAKAARRALEKSNYPISSREARSEMGASGFGLGDTPRVDTDGTWLVKKLQWTLTIGSTIKGRPLLGFELAAFGTAYCRSVALSGSSSGSDFS